MKLHRAHPDHFELRLSKREHHALCALLREFPLTPLEHHRIEHGAAAEAEANPEQQLLTESMHAHRDEWRERVDRFLTGGHRFTHTGEGYRLELNAEEMEWLLQVLNEVRVGCWMKLGSPDSEAGQPPQLSVENLRFLAMMEMTSRFEHELLAALDGTDGVGWGGPGE